MSKSVKIPNNSSPTWDCEIGNTKYSYPSGTTQTVPDEVAVVINNYYDSLPKEATPVDPWASMPIATETKAGAMKMGASVDDVSDEYVEADSFNSLLASLRSAGIIAYPEEAEDGE